MADAKSVLEFAKKNGAKLLDLRFTDLPGLWHHVSYPMEMVSESSFEDGFGMDGSSHPRLGCHSRERHAAHPGPQTAS